MDMENTGFLVLAGKGGNGESCLIESLDRGFFS
jgi:hypothetical protein